MEQRMLYHYTMIGLQKDANKFLKNGWRIVPGSIGGTTTHRAAKSANEYETQAKDGKVFASAFWCVVEVDTSADTDAAAEGR